MSVFVRLEKGQVLSIGDNFNLLIGLWGDYDRFVYPTIENIKVNVSLMSWITEARFDYRNEYYSYTQGKTIYRVFPLQVRYTDDFDSYSAQIDQTVRKYTILQNTAFILKELSNLVNQRQYYTAILLVDSQIRLLKGFLEEGPDDEISGDIETLTRNKNLLMEQARSLQYIR